MLESVLRRMKETGREAPQPFIPTRVVVHDSAAACPLARMFRLPIAGSIAHGCEI